MDFNLKIAKDGTKVDNLEELTIHEYIINYCSLEVKYSGRNMEYKFINKKHSENYIPDWIIGGKVIVEYFGWYKPKSNNPIFKEYVQKTHRKIEYFSSLIDYQFIPLFREDLKHDLQGVSKIISNIKTSLIIITKTIYLLIYNK